VGAREKIEGEEKKDESMLTFRGAARKGGEREGSVGGGDLKKPIAPGRDQKTRGCGGWGGGEESRFWVVVGDGHAKNYSSSSWGIRRGQGDFEEPRGKRESGD